MPHGGQLVIETANAELDPAYCAEHPETKPGRYALLAVSDTGCGMSAEVKSHLFEPFFTTKEQGKGTGLGLATVYGIVTQSGGHITVQSEEGIGTTFKVFLPVAAEVAAPVQKPRKDSGVRRGVETILLIEDEERVRRLVHEMLTTAGYHVLEAINGSDAVEKYGHYAGPIHLMISDMIMPG
ncbi:MAG: response regulator, partial [Verrucomicrobia bacterium]|nr:response regulator [Verrucomicrobiota bacterium]